jgi:hydrogenase maturation factor
MEEIVMTANALRIQVMGGHTEVTDVVNRPVITVTGVGKVKKDCLVSTGGMQPGDDLVMTKWAGLEGTGIIVQEKREELSARLPQELLDAAEKLGQEISVIPEAAVGVQHGVTAMHDVTEGGIFGALWEMGEASGTGLTVDLEKIPIRQETIEICEFYDINPYMLISSGSMLMATPKGNLLVEQLQEKGIAAAVIGRAVEGHDRIVRSGEEKRFLEPAGSDHLYKIYS